MMVPGQKAHFSNFLEKLGGEEIKFNPSKIFLHPVELATIFYLWEVEEMPYKSAKQRSWMHVNKPGLAEEWDKKYGGTIGGKAKKAKKRKKK